MAEELLIDQVTDVTHGVYQPYGGHHWPKYPWMSYQFRRALGETQEGGGAVSECFLAASRMIPGDKESWHREWKRIADFNQARGDEEFGKGHVRTAMNCWLRAANYYRHADFFLLGTDPRKRADFIRTSECFKDAAKLQTPKIEFVQVTCGTDVYDGYFLHPRDPAPSPGALLNWTNFNNFIRNNNNVTWRNFNVVDNDPSLDPQAPKGFVALPFLVPGAFVASINCMASDDWACAQRLAVRQTAVRMHLRSFGITYGCLRSPLKSIPACRSLPQTV